MAPDVLYQELLRYKLIRQLRNALHETVLEVFAEGKKCFNCAEILPYLPAEMINARNLEDHSRFFKPFFNRCLLRWISVGNTSLFLPPSVNVGYSHDACNLLRERSFLKTEDANCNRSESEVRADCQTSPETNLESKKNEFAFFAKEVSLNIPQKLSPPFPSSDRVYNLSCFAYTIILLVHYNRDSLRSLTPRTLFPCFEWCLKILLFTFQEFQCSNFYEASILSSFMCKFKLSYDDVNDGGAAIALFLQSFLNLRKNAAHFDECMNQVIEKKDSELFKEYDMWFQNKILPYEGCEFESKDVNKTKNLRSKWEQLNRTDWYDCTREIWTVRSYAEPLIFCVHSQQIENLYTTFNLAVLEAERKVSQCDFRSLSKDYDSKQVIRKSNLKETNSWKPSWKKNDESSRSFIPSVNMKIKSFSTAKIDSFRPHLSGHVPMSSCNELSKAIGMESSCASVIWELANQMSRFFLSSGCKKQFENLCGVDCLSTEKITSFSIGHHLVEKLWKRYSATLNKRNTMHKKEWIHLDSMNLSGDAYKYVKAIYENADSAQREEFSESIFKLLLRYHTICDPEEFSGIGLQSAVPSQFLALLREYFEVECECFASPFNSALNSYYSAFYDTDNDFGSYGSFFADDVKLDSGSYEANPPFDEFVIDRMADRFLQFLREASGPLSFAIVVPDWDNAECLYLEKLLSNEFFQDTFVALPKKHFFISGVFDGELSRQTTLKLIPKSPNRFILLQNEIARSKWPCSAEKMLKLRKAWMLQEEQPRHSHLKWRE